MPSAHDIVSEIRVFLTSQQARSKKELAVLAEAYTSLCQRVNTRLRRTADYLRRGLHVEAIYEAEIKPNLLDLIGALDLMEHTKDWTTVCQKNGLEMAPDLRMEIAEELSLAYATYEKKEDLYRRYRLLSLAKAPGKDRLSMLHALARQNPECSLLSQDVATFEDARIHEMQKECEEAFQAKDQPALETMLAELTETTWRNKQTDLLATHIRDQIRGMREEKATQRLRTLAEELHKAFMANAIGECRELREEWNRILEHYQISPPAELLEEVRPALNWVAQCDREENLQRKFRQACVDLERVISGEKPDLTELKRLHVRVLSFDMPLDEELQERYDSRVRELELRRKRIVFRRYVVGVMLSLGMAGGAGVLIHRGIIHNRTRGQCNQIRVAVEAGKLNDAEEMFNSLRSSDPTVYQRPEIQSLLREFLDVQEDHKQKSKECRDRLAEFDKIDLKDPNAKKLLDEADPLAVTTELKKEVHSRREKLDAFRDNRQREIDEAFLEKLDKLWEEYRKTDNKLADKNPKEFGKTLGSIEDRLANLLVVTPNVSSGVKKNSERLQKVLTNWQVAAKESQKRKDDEWERQEAERKQREAEQRALQNLARTTSTPDQLVKKLREFAKKYPQHAKSPQFVEAVKDREKWQAVHDWSILVESWGGKMLPDQTEKLTTRIKELGDYANKYPESPLCPVAQKYSTFLSKAAEALGGKSYWKVILPNQMNSDIMNLQCFEIQPGQPYYMSKNEKMHDTSIGITVKVLLTLDPSKPVARTFKGIQEKNLAKKPQPAPQGKMATKILTLLLDFGDANWDTLPLDIAREILNSKEVDPILRAQVLDVVLGHVQRSSWIELPDVARTVELFERFKLLDVYWTNPEDKTVAIQRQRAVQILERLKSLDSFKDKLAAEREKLYAGISRIPKYGIALRDDQGRWCAYTCSGGMVGKAAFYVIGGNPSAGNHVLRNVGQTDKVVERVSLREDAMKGIPEGSMVFIFPER